MIRVKHMARVKQIAEENGTASLRLTALLLRMGVQSGDGASLSLFLGLRRNLEGIPSFTARLGAAHSTAPTLGGALLSALDQLGIS